VPELHVRLPQALSYLKTWWDELNLGRKASSMGGAQSLDFQDVAAWAVVTRRSLAPAELRVLMAIERAYWAAQASAKSQELSDGV
jgi:hypothetical protein